MVKLYTPNNQLGNDFSLRNFLVLMIEAFESGTHHQHLRRNAGMIGA